MNNKHIRTDRMSRVSKTSKVYPGIKVSHDATDGQPKPYEKYRRGKGMPGAHEPVEELSEQARKTFDKAFKHKKDEKIGNAKDVDVCGNSKCPAYSKRKVSNCAIHIDAGTCLIMSKKPRSITVEDIIKDEQRTKKSKRKEAK